MNKLDLANPDNIDLVRMAFGCMQTLLLLVAGYIFLSINRRNQQTKIKVPPPQKFMATPEPPQVMTICEYDHSQLRKWAGQILMGSIITGFLHYKWGFVPPLFIQTFLNPINMIQMPLFHRYVQASFPDQLSNYTTMGKYGMFVTLPVLLLMNKLDLANPDNIDLVRMAFGCMQTLLLLVAGYIYFSINSRNQQTKIKVTPPSKFMAAPEAPEVMTIREYDLSQLRKWAGQILMGSIITGFLHYKWGFVPPLFIQTFLNPINMIQMPLFQIHVLGWSDDGDRKRPWKADENPFASMMPKVDEPAAQGEGTNNTDDGDVADTDAATATKAVEHKKKSKKSKKHN